MTSFAPSGILTAILPCNDLDASERFYHRLGFTRSDGHRLPTGEADGYRLLSNGGGGYLHLTDAVAGWLVPGSNPFGLYLYTEDVDALAAEFRDEVIGGTRRRTNPGACTNSPFPIRTRRWSESAGRPGFGDRSEPAFPALTPTAASRSHGPAS